MLPRQITALQPWPGTRLVRSLGWFQTGVPIVLHLNVPPTHAFLLLSCSFV